MIKWSVAFYREEAIVDKIYVALTLADGTKLSLTEVDVWDNGFVRDTSTSVSDTFTVGGAVTAKATLILDNTDQKFTDYNFRKATAVVKLSAEVNGTEEVHPAGSYIVDDYEISGSTIILTMLDYMSKFDKKYDASKITWPASLDTIVRNACTECGVIFGMSSFPNQSFVVRKAPNDAAITYHDIISYAAQIACCWAKCSTGGQLLFGWYSTTYTKMKDGLDGGIYDQTDQASYQSGDKADGGDFTFTDSYSYDAGAPLSKDDTGHGIVYLYSVDKIQTDDVLITGVTVTASEEVTDDAGNTSTKIGTYTEGSSGYVIQIDKNPLIGADDCQAVAGYLKPLIGMKFRPLTVTAVGNPAVEAGDCALVGYEDKSYACFLSNVSYTMGGSMTASCDAQPDKEATPYRYTETQKTEAKISELIQKERSARELAIQNFTEKLSSHAGLYSTVEKGESGGNVYYLHDHPQLSDSTIVWKMTAEAWGVSTDGGKTWNGGMMVNGDVIARILTATGINADWINTGQLSVKKDGKEVLFVDVDTGTVRIVADTFSMSSGETIQSIVDNAIEESVQTFLGTGAPSISGYPASSWSTTSTKEKHIGALYYDTQTGHIYRYTHKVGAVRIKFDSQSNSEAARYDYVRVLYSKDGKLYRTQDVGGASFPDMVVPSADFYVYWHSDSSSTGWGFKIDNVASEMSGEAGENDTEVSSLPISDYTTVTDATTVQTKTHPYDNNESYMWLVKTGLSLGATTYTWTELSGVKTYAQEEQPAVAAEGDVWIDTDDGNLFYRYTNGKWTEYRDAAIEQALQDAKEYADQVVGTATDSVVDTYYGNGVPTNSNYPRSSWKSVELNSHIGDMYYDLSTGRAYRFVSTSGGVVLSFDSQSKTESANYDWVIVYYNKDGQLYSTEKRGGTSFEDLFVPSADFYVYWRSDSSNTGWGFKISGVTTASKDSDGFIETKTSTLPKSDYTTVTDATTVETDSHPYTDGESKMWLVNTGLTLPSTSYQWSEISDTRIAQAIKDAGDAQATADGKIKTFAQTAEPTDGMSVGDLWIDTDDNNKLYRWNGSSWIQYTDTSSLHAWIEGEYADTLTEVKSQIDQKAETWYQAADPSKDWTTAAAKAEHKGDLWFCTATSGNYKQKTWQWDGNRWQEVKTTPPADVMDTIDGKAQIFVARPAPPYSVGDLWFDSATADIMTCITARESGSFTAGDWQKRNKYTDDTALTAFTNGDYARFVTATEEGIHDVQTTAGKKITTFYQEERPTGQATGDLWISTGDGNKLYRWNGSSWAAVQDAGIQEAIRKAGTAQTTADGKIMTYAQNTAPANTTADPLDVGDLWIDTDDNNKLYRYSGSSWVAYRDGQIAENLQTAKDYADDTAEKAAKAAVDAQTQTDIFNKLTNSGKLKGLFMKDGKLYISASYILSGILKLGGASNGNGTLEIYNSSGTKIGTFDNTGINLGSGKFVADTSGNVTAKNITAYGSFICYENN